MSGGARVVLLHCSSSAGAQWRALVERLADRFDVAAPDLLGYGRDAAPWPLDRPLSLGDEVDAIAELLAGDETPVHLVGHSYGGLIAMTAALGGWVPVRSLTLIEPIAFWMLREAGEHAGWTEIAKLGMAFNAGVEAGDPVPGARAYFDYWHGVGAWDNAPAELRDYVLRTAPKTYWEWRSAAEPTVAASWFAEWRVPTLVVKGSTTQPTIRRVAELLADALPAREVVEIPGAGHMSPITHPEDVNDAIEAFILAQG